MAGGRFSKQASPYLSEGRFLNGNNATGETVTGGLITAAPSGILPGMNIFCFSTAAFCPSSVRYVRCTMAALPSGPVSIASIQG